MSTKVVNRKDWRAVHIYAMIMTAAVLVLFSRLNTVQMDYYELNAQLAQEQRVTDDLRIDADIDAQMITSLENRLLVAKKQNQDLVNKLEANKKPYKPELALTPLQNKLCLAIATFTETNGEPSAARETIAWAITNRAIDPRSTDPNYRGRFYHNNICAVVASRGQYSGMGPYLTDIEDVVWGKIDSFTPALAKKNPEEMKAWKDIWKTSSDLIDGKLTRKTLATYFISWRGMRGAKRPSWVESFMPAYSESESGLHSLFLDYGYDRETGKVVYFTRNNPYDPNKHTI